MYPTPEPIEHQQRMKVAQTIAQRLSARYRDSVKAIGLYGSLASNEDGPYSDIEMFCVLKTPGEIHTYEWCTGPWKAEVNVIDEVSLRRQAAQLEGDWALTHGAFVRVFPLTDPKNYFAELSTLALSHSPDLFRQTIEDVLIGEIYELIGKVRNAQVRGHYQALPILAVKLVQQTAYALGLEYRHLYSSSTLVLDEAVRLPDPPEGFFALAYMVMSGNLQHAPEVISACNDLWSGLVYWANERNYILTSPQNIPF